MLSPGCARTCRQNIVCIIKISLLKTEYVCAGIVFYFLDLSCNVTSTERIPVVVIFKFEILKEYSLRDSVTYSKIHVFAIVHGTVISC